MTNPCEWNGTVYPSQVAAARAAGRNPSTIAGHLRDRGDLSRIGKSKGRLPCPFDLDGRSWPSVSAFARHVGRPKNTVYGWMRLRRLDRLRAALAAAEGRA